MCRSDATHPSSKGRSFYLYSSFKLREFTRKKKSVLTTVRINIQIELKICVLVVIFYDCCGGFYFISKKLMHLTKNTFPGT